ncbi:MAG: hypothetical protein JWP59_4043 [Massilia sp.]|nr:hypothetical protein [Massilia sp.]
MAVFPSETPDLVPLRRILANYALLQIFDST